MWTCFHSRRQILPNVALFFKNIVHLRPYETNFIVYHILLFSASITWYQWQLHSLLNSFVYSTFSWYTY